MCFRCLWWHTALLFGAPTLIILLYCLIPSIFLFIYLFFFQFLFFICPTNRLVYFGHILLTTRLTSFLQFQYSCSFWDKFRTTKYRNNLSVNYLLKLGYLFTYLLRGLSLQANYTDRATAAELCYVSLISWILAVVYTAIFWWLRIFQLRFEVILASPFFHTSLFFFRVTAFLMGIWH
jgi:hypothetical protein